MKYLTIFFIIVFADRTLVQADWFDNDGPGPKPSADCVWNMVQKYPKINAPDQCRDQFESLSYEFGKRSYDNLCSLTLRSQCEICGASEKCRDLDDDLDSDEHLHARKRRRAPAPAPGSHFRFIGYGYIPNENQFAQEPAPGQDDQYWDQENFYNPEQNDGQVHEGVAYLHGDDEFVKSADVKDSNVWVEGGGRPPVAGVEKYTEGGGKPTEDGGEILDFFMIKWYCAYICRCICSLQNGSDVQCTSPQIHRPDYKPNNTIVECKCGGGCTKGRLDLKGIEQLFINNCMNPQDIFCESDRTTTTRITRTPATTYTTPASQCDVNEHYDYYKGDATCDNFCGRCSEERYCYYVNGIRGCVCNEGYRRNQYDKCVREDQCTDDLFSLSCNYAVDGKISCTWPGVKYARAYAIIVNGGGSKARIYILPRDMRSMLFNAAKENVNYNIVLKAFNEQVYTKKHLNQVDVGEYELSRPFVRRLAGVTPVYIDEVVEFTRWRTAILLTTGTGGLMVKYSDNNYISQWFSNQSMQTSGRPYKTEYTIVDAAAELPININKFPETGNSCPRYQTNDMRQCYQSQCTIGVGRTGDQSIRCV